MVGIAGAALFMDPEIPLYLGTLLVMGSGACYSFGRSMSDDALRGEALSDFEKVVKGLDSSRG